jgi:hypothetical protein
VGVYEDQVVRHYQTHLARRRAFRPPHEYRQPTDVEWAEFAVEQVDKNKKTSVPIKLILSGRGLTANHQYLHVFLEIPIDSAARQRNIRAFINRTKADPQATEQQLKLLDLYGTSTVPALESLYMENSVGEYELSCMYTLSPAGGPLKSIRSRPINIRVVFEGHFFDKPNFRSQKP